MSLDKLIALAGRGAGAPAGSADPAAELVTAIRRNLAEVRTYLASGGDDEDEKPKKKGGDSDDEDNDHSGHPTFKAMTKRGVDEAKAKSMCAKADKRTKVAACAEQAELLLSALDSAPGDWVEATAEDSLAVVALSGKPAGNREAFADPGYLGKCRFRIDTLDSTRLSLAYTSQPSRMRAYSPVQRDAIAGRVAGAAHRYGLGTVAIGERAAVAEVLTALSTLTAEERKKPSAHTLGDSDDYPIPDKAHLSAAVARYKQGKFAGHSASEVAAHIRSRARALGETVDLASGSGLDEAAEAFALAAKPVGDGGIPMNHGPFNGTHTHTHFQSGAHAHPHQHANDNNHNGGPLHRQGSQPKYGRGDW
jgi:hypothetical protein